MCLCEVFVGARRMYCEDKKVRKLRVTMYIGYRQQTARARKEAGLDGAETFFWGNLGVRQEEIGVGRRRCWR